MKAAVRRFVLDASVAVAWCFDDETTPLSEAVLNLLSRGSEALAPAIWPLEVANALLTAERRKRISVAQVTAQLGRIGKLPIAIEPASTVFAFDQVLPVARQQQLTEYDATYIELALRSAIPLATLDDKLRQAALVTGIRLVSI
jgi:predicted nucleic acid-binding protein